MIRITLFYLLLAMLLGCEQSTTSGVPHDAMDEANENKVEGKSPGKPGASVSLKTPQPYFIEAPGVANLELWLEAAKSSGILQADVSVGAGLELLSPQTHYEFSLVQGGVYPVPIQIAMAKAGRYYVNLRLSIQDGSERESRTIAAIVQVGAPITKALKNPVSTANNSSEAAVIELPAQETLGTNR